MVAITVLLAATAASFFVGLGQQATANKVPTAAFSESLDVEDGSHVLTVSHQGGNTIGHDTLRVVVANATCANGNDPNTRYAPGGLGNGDSRIVAGSVLKLDSWTLCGSKTTDLDLSHAEVSVVWVSDDRTTSTTLWRWRGPRA